MLEENQLLVVQKIFQWEGRDPNWIHKQLLKNLDYVAMKQISKVSKTTIENTLNQWPWQLAWNNEDLGQSALTEAHGDNTGGQNSPWEPQIEKRSWFSMRVSASLGKQGQNGRAYTLGHVGS